MLNRALFGLIVAVVVTTSAAAGPYEDAYSAYSRNDYEGALKRWQPLARDGDADAQFSVGVLYDEGYGVSKDSTEAAKWYRLAAAQGNADAQRRLGYMYVNGQGVPKDYAEAVKWFRLAAEQGDAYAQVRLGDMYHTGEGVPQDDAESAKWYQLAAAQGYVRPSASLSPKFHVNDQDVAYVPPTDAATAAALDHALAVYQAGDYATALKLWRQLAQQGYAEAQLRLGYMYDAGKGVPPDYGEALKWFRLAAAQSNAPAQFYLGWMAEFGQGIATDYAEAMKWYRLAAAQRNVDAQTRLANLDAKGRAEAVVRWLAFGSFCLVVGAIVRWRRRELRYRKAGARGDARAQIKLGDMYAGGKGVPQDYAEAMNWYRLAADQGNTDAQTRLGLMYADGHRVSQDLIQAHMWFNLAAAKGLRKAVRARDAVANLMAPDQVVQAQRMAREKYISPNPSSDAPKRTGAMRSPRFLGKLWRGEYDLGEAFWGFFVSVGFVLFIAGALLDLTLVMGLGLRGAAHGGSFASAFVLFILWPYQAIAAVGVWRSAARSLASPISNSNFWGFAARAFIFLLAVSAIWYLLNGGLEKMLLQITQ